MGGALTDHATWRWCFYINLPFGGLAVLFILIFLPLNIATVQSLGWKERLKQFDLPGTFFLIPSILCLIFALQWGGSMWAWSNFRIIALFIVSGVSFMIFIGIQIWQEDQATIPLRLMKNRNIWGAVWY
jgi:MFS family permease